MFRLLIGERLLLLKDNYQVLDLRALWSHEDWMNAFVLVYANRPYPWDIDGKLLGSHC